MTLQAMTENIDRDKADIHILDLGCGEGFIVKTAFNEGYKVTGIDFSSFGIDKWNPEIAHLCQFGDIYKLLDEAVVSGQRYDVCILRNVLEHVIDPAGLLVKIRKILNVGGIAIISVPNDYSALQDLALSKGMIDREFWFAPPDHLYYFNTENIVPFMQKNDYAVMDMFSSFPVDFFLFHEGSNYIKNRSAGKAAHNARITIDLLLAQQGMEKFLNLYRAMAACGVGRDFTVVVKPA
jgi:SAM-dependent methyltransferase